MSEATDCSSSLARSRNTWRSSQRVETIFHWERIADILDFSDWRSLVLPLSFQTSGVPRSASISESLFSRAGISKIPPHGAKPLANGCYLLLEVCYHAPVALSPSLRNVNAAIMDSTAHRTGIRGPNRT
ncbi:MAG: hypothetical protein BWX71_02325 [Deltaproteobacteria bacterium ADurb.Bin072]|nr:MAG: hypothetical protein BWX71_02325 [Deltaproteobacteria bacterium ADurb.Bin072]